MSTVSQSGTKDDVREAKCQLRINYVLPRPNLGGGIKSSKLIAEAMQRRGHDVRIVFVSKSRPLPPVWRVRSFAKAAARRVSNMICGQEHHLMRSTAALIAVPKLRIEASDAPDADVTVGSWWETMEWIQTWPASKGLRVHYIRGHEVFVREELRSRVRDVYRLDNLKITNSYYLQRVMREVYGASAEVVHNGVDWTQFSSTPRARNALPRIGFLVGAHYLKGAHTALAACQLLQQVLPELEVVAFGLEPLAPKLRLPANFEYHVRPPQHSIAALYKSCDCWIVPSITEGLPMPGLEAAGCRCPIVATRCGGTEDYVQDGINGYLVDVENPIQMCDRVLEVLRASDWRWREMSEASYRIARTFDWDESASRLEAILLGALAKH